MDSGDDYDADFPPYYAETAECFLNLLALVFLLLLRDSCGFFNSGEKFKLFTVLFEQL
jgi:hypothetical protein